MGCEGGGAWGGKKRLLCEGMYRVPTGCLAQSVAGRGRSSTPTPSLSQKSHQPSKFCASLMIQLYFKSLTIKDFICALIRHDSKGLRCESVNTRSKLGV